MASETRNGRATIKVRLASPELLRKLCEEQLRNGALLVNTSGSLQEGSPVVVILNLDGVEQELHIAGVVTPRLVDGSPRGLMIAIDDPETAVSAAESYLSFSLSLLEDVYEESIGAERRAHPRFQAQIQVRLRISESSHFDDLVTKDLSRGGLFIVSESPADTGTQVEVTIFPPGDLPQLTVRGIVSHLIRPSPASLDQPGMGIQLLEVAPGTQAMIDEIIRRVSVPPDTPYVTGGHGVIPPPDHQAWGLSEPTVGYGDAPRAAEPPPPLVQPPPDVDFGPREPQAAMPPPPESSQPWDDAAGFGSAPPAGQPERRVDPRLVDRLPVKVRPTDLRHFRELYTRDISQGGLFVFTDEPYDLETAVELLLYPPSGTDPFPMHGQVVHRVSPEEAQREGGFPGMGIKLFPLDPYAQTAIEDIISRVLDNEGPDDARPEPPPPEPDAESTASRPPVPSESPPHQSEPVQPQSMIPDWPSQPTGWTDAEQPPNPSPEAFPRSPPSPPPPLQPATDPAADRYDSPFGYTSTDTFDSEPVIPAPPILEKPSRRPEDFPPPAQPVVDPRSAVVHQSAAEHRSRVSRFDNPRATGGVQMVLHFDDLDDFRESYERDFSRGGAFLPTAEILPLRATIELVLVPPGSDRGIALIGEVVHVTPASRARPDLEAGMGIQFLDLTPEKKRHIEFLIRGQAPEGATIPVPGTAAAADEESVLELDDVVMEPEPEPEPEPPPPPAAPVAPSYVPPRQAYPADATPVPDPPPPAGDVGAQDVPAESDLDRMLDREFSDSPPQPPSSQSGQFEVPVVPKAPWMQARTETEDEEGKLSVQQAQEMLSSLEKALRKSYYHALSLKHTSSIERVKAAIEHRMRPFLLESHPGGVADGAVDLLRVAQEHLAVVRETLTEPGRRSAYECSLGLFSSGYDDEEPQVERVRYQVRQQFRERFAQEFPDKIRKGEEYFRAALENLRGQQRSQALLNIKLALSYNPLSDEYHEMLDSLQQKG